MLDPKVVDTLIEEQIVKSIDAQVAEIFATDAWVKPIESKIVQYAQERILGKFANSATIPELIDAVKVGIGELFADGKIPGVDQYVDSETVKTAIDQAVNDNILTAIYDLGNDPTWVEKIEKLTIQSMVQRVVAELSTIDVYETIRRRIDSNMLNLVDSVVQKLQTPGIQTQASQVELTVIDGAVVVKNNFVATTAEITDGLRVTNLAVTGSINVDNPSWQTLSENISQKTLEKLSDAWRDSLIEDVAEHVKQHGVDFDDVTVDGQKLISGDQLNYSIRHSRLQSVGDLHNLSVNGEAHIHNTLSVVNRRIGVNTTAPQSALSVWDEEVAINIGKFKNNTAYIGTNQHQGMHIGVNRQSAIEIDSEANTTIKNLRLGIHKVSFAAELPNYAGSKGELVFNSNPNINDTVFAWVCLGGHKWKVLRGA